VRFAKQSKERKKKIKEGQHKPNKAKTKRGEKRMMLIA